ncbi:MAG: hypothetical protein KF745_05670 [Phycisphaeraceae bacterium]|nr:hypothetical protein [Phycisphaeraceae bacterium]
MDTKKKNVILGSIAALLIVVALFFAFRGDGSAGATEDTKASDELARQLNEANPPQPEPVIDPNVPVRNPRQLRGPGE